jgi:hypothetical protein
MKCPLNLSGVVASRPARLAAIFSLVERFPVVPVLSPRLSPGLSISDMSVIAA